MKHFGLRYCLQENYYLLFECNVTSTKKMGMISVNKMSENWNYQQKMSTLKVVSIKLYEIEFYR